MRLKLTILIFVGLAANNCICQSSLNLLGVHITWNNLGDRTEFNVTSSLSPGVDVNDAWIGVGLNNETSMVQKFSQIRIILKNISDLKLILKETRQCNYMPKWTKC